MLIGIETQIRQAIREAVNRSSRKPFAWGGLRGYEQLEAIARGLDQIQEPSLENNYLQLLRTRIERVLAKNRTAAEDLKIAHQILLKVSDCLHYPPSTRRLPGEPLNSQLVAQEMAKLIQETKATGKVQRAQLSLLHGLKNRWELFGQELLFCYDIPGLPQDNLQLESLFGRLRRHQRRISGCKSTRELLIFGQAQAFFSAKSLLELLAQIQRVPRETYLFQRNRLAEAELSRQFFRRLHHNPLAAISALIHLHSVRSQSSGLHEAPVL